MSFMLTDRGLTTTASLCYVLEAPVVQVYWLVPCAGCRCEAAAVVHDGCVVVNSRTGCGASIQVRQNLSKGSQPALELHLLRLQHGVVCLHCHKVLAGHS
jgi:hypothetical protein